MSREPVNPRKPPTAERIAAHVDGELDAQQRADVESWLVAHPEAMAEAASWRRLDELMRASRPPEPGPQQWATTRQRIDTALEEWRRRPTSPLLRLLIGIAAAAAAVVAVWLTQGGGLPSRSDEPFPVASFQDVIILSIDPRDANALVVGHPPAVDPIVLATPEEVTLVRAEPDSEGISPDMWSGPGSAPMIVPAGGADGR